MAKKHDSTPSKKAFETAVMWMQEAIGHNDAMASGLDIEIKRRLRENPKADVAKMRLDHTTYTDVVKQIQSVIKWMEQQRRA